jgi:hypothetical protein
MSLPTQWDVRYQKKKAKGTHALHLDQRNILEYFSNSEHHPLEFYGYSIIDDDGLLTLVELCPTLQELIIAFSYPLYKHNGTHFSPSLTDLNIPRIECYVENHFE